MMKLHSSNGRYMSWLYRLLLLEFYPLPYKYLGIDDPGFYSKFQLSNRDTERK